MASFASIISILVLLAAYGYSVPLEGKWQTSTLTPQFEFTTGKTIVDNKDKITAHLLNPKDAANVPVAVIPREFLAKFELSTPATLESHERDSRESPMFFDKLTTSSPFTPTTELPSSKFMPRAFDETKFVDTTTWRSPNSAEVKVPMPKRAFESKERVDKSNSAEVFGTTPFPKRAFESKERVDKSNSAEVFGTTPFPKRAFESKERVDKSNSAEVFGTTPFPKRAFESKERVMDKSNSAEVFGTTPFPKRAFESKERVDKSNSAEVFGTTPKMSSGLKSSVKSTSVEVDRSSEELTTGRPVKLPPRGPNKAKIPVDN